MVESIWSVSRALSVFSRVCSHLNVRMTRPHDTLYRSAEFCALQESFAGTWMLVWGIQIILLFAFAQPVPCSVLHTICAQG
jgi:hypothetical protein